VRKKRQTGKGDSVHGAMKVRGEGAGSKENSHVMSERPRQGQVQYDAKRMLYLRGPQGKSDRRDEKKSECRDEVEKKRKTRTAR